MNDVTKKNGTELIRTDAPHFSDKEWKELNDYLQGKNGKIYNISEKVANNFLTLYLAGRSVTEIQESFPEWPQGAILHAAFHYKWHLKKQDHLSRLMRQSKERLPTVQMEIVNHALDRLTVAHAQFRKEMERYLQNPTPENLPRNCIRSTNEYKQVLEIIEKAISLGRQPDAKDPNDPQQGATLNLNITTDPKPEMKVTPVESPEKTEEVVDAEHSEIKEPEKVATEINGVTITQEEHSAILKALASNENKNDLTSITYNEKVMGIYDIMLLPCQTQDDLHNWIISFFGLDMPDCTVCERSTSNPMNMIWNVYTAAKDGLVEESSQLYFASRDSYKTLSAAIVEVLIMIHFKRTASHMGAIKQQSKKCYDYFKRFMSMTPLNKIKRMSDTQERTELDLPNAWNMNPYLQIVICTMQGANSEHTHFMCVDEVDVVKNVQAYREAKKIPSETPDKKPSITLYISTRKSPFGLVQYEVDNAKKSGLKVRSWNIVDVGQPCPADKSRIEEGTVKRYYKENDLMIHSKETLMTLSPADASECEEVDLYNGCLSCAIAPLCLGRLATKQTGGSLLLKSHADIEKKFRESEIDDALAQLMCYKPSLHGLVFSRLNEQSSFMNATQMWEKVTGETAKKEITKQELIDTFHKYNIPAYAGIDWGWNTSVCLVVFIDSRENIYVVHELSMNHVDDPDFIDIIKNKIHPIYKIQMYFPDTENPSGINLMKKENLSVSSKVVKDIHLGVQTIKRYMKLPGLGTTKFFMLDSECPGLVKEFRKYHLLLDAASQIVSHDKYADEFNHRIDALRYVITNTLARMTATFDFMELPSYTGKKDGLKNQDGNFQKVPTAEELATHMGRTDFQDNRDDVEKDPKGGKGDGGGGSGFSWSM